MLHRMSQTPSFTGTEGDQGSPADSLSAGSLAVILDGMRQRDEGAPFGERDPQDVPRLIAALEAVLAIHRLAPMHGVCMGCGYAMPCPTYAAVGRALEARQ